jgi:hypothetical protein
MARPKPIEVPSDFTKDISIPKLDAQIENTKESISNLIKRSAPFRVSNGEVTFLTQAETMANEISLKEANHKLAILLAIKNSIPSSLRVIRVQPEDGATGVFPNSAISVTFSQQIDPSTLIG